MTYIKKITISKLFGKQDINWHLDPKVNILIGKNGSGKTTLLRLIRDFMRSSQGRFFAPAIIAFMKIELSDNQYIYVSKDSEAFSQSDVNKPNAVLEPVPMNKGIYQIESNIFPQTDTNNLFSEVINICYINTFDIFTEKFYVLKSYKKTDAIETDLDEILDCLIDDWKSYLLKLKKLEEKVTVAFDKKIEQLSSKEITGKNDLQALKKLLNDKTAQINEINFYKNKFFEQINRLFADSNKQIDFDKNNAIIFRTHNDKALSVYELSAGEKQMLIILLSVLIQENQPSIILMDEPEISLHLAWQLDLIDIIQCLNENCQLIIVTHAAGVFNKGWKDKITKMENIIAG